MNLRVSLAFRRDIILGKTDTGDNQLMRWYTLTEILHYESPFEPGNKAANVAILMQSKGTKDNPVQWDGSGATALEKTPKNEPQREARQGIHPGHSY